VRAAFPELAKRSYWTGDPDAVGILLSLQAVRAKFTMKVDSTFIDFVLEQDAER